MAASTDDTGHALFGGDWDFEYSSGAIETGVAFSMDVQQHWSHVMALETYFDDFRTNDFSGDWGSASLISLSTYSFRKPPMLRCYEVPASGFISKLPRYSK